MSDVAIYLRGWDDAMRCHAESLSWVPNEHLPFVVRETAKRLGVPDRSGASTSDPGAR